MDSKKILNLVTIVMFVITVGDSSVYPPETSDEKLYRISRSSRSHPDRVCTG